jgi:hypothetical protein
MWIARNEGDSHCHLFVHKPTKVYDKYQKRWAWVSYTDDWIVRFWDGLPLPASQHEVVTFENSPIEVELKFK